MKKIVKLIICTLLITSSTLSYSKSVNYYLTEIKDKISKDQRCVNDPSFSCDRAKKEIVLTVGNNECKDAPGSIDCDNAKKAIFKYLDARDKSEKAASKKQALINEKQAKKTEATKKSKLDIMVIELKAMPYKDYIDFEQYCYGYDKKNENQRLKCSAVSYDMKQEILTNSASALRADVGDENIEAHIKKVCYGAEKDKLLCDVARHAQKTMSADRYKKQTNRKAAYKEGKEIFKNDYNMCRNKIITISGKSKLDGGIVFRALDKMKEPEKSICKMVKDIAFGHLNISGARSFDGPL